jgi:hypothetical protein
VISTLIKAKILINAPKSGRPPTIAPGGDFEREILGKIGKGSQNGREEQAGKLAHELGVGTDGMLRFLNKHGYNPFKTTKTPDLDE